MTPVGVVLAGGAGSRMGGRDKALVTLAGRPLLDHVLDRIRPQVAAVAVAAGDDPGRFAGWDLPALSDPVPGQVEQSLYSVIRGNDKERKIDTATNFHPPYANAPPGRAGPLAGILAGMEWAATQGAAWLLSVPTDAPFLPPDLVERLAAARGDARIAVAASGGRTHFVTALWPVGLAADLRTTLGRDVRKVEDFARRHPLAIAEFPVTHFDPFLNVNRPEDLAAAEARLLQAGLP